MDKRLLWLAILIPLFLGIFLRAQPITLPQTDDMAENMVKQRFLQQTQLNLRQQYPNLPMAELQQRALEDFNSAKNTQQYQQAVETYSQQIKNRMQTDSGQTYLLAIDPYLWMGYAENYLENGHFGDTKINGEPHYTLRDGRFPQPTTFKLLPFMEALNYRFLNIFGDVSMMTAAFYLPLILMTIAIIGAFIVGWLISDFQGGFIASMVVAIHSQLLRRTTAGFSDTDPIIALGEIFAVLFVVLAFMADKNKRVWLWSIIAGVLIGLYSIGHQSWWHIYDFLLGAVILYSAIIFAKNKGMINPDILQKIKIVPGLVIGTIVSGTIFNLTRMSLGEAFSKMVLNPITQPFKFIQFKDVVVKSLWPNVMTTVAELNKSSIGKTIEGLGGNIFMMLVIIGLFGYIYSYLKRDDKNSLFFAILFVFWLAGAFYAADKSVRFIALIVPVAAFSIIGIFKFTEIHLRQMAKSIQLDYRIAYTVVIIAVLAITMMPIAESSIQISKQRIPQMNDAWYGALKEINQDSQDAIITSWWDFGHWFVTVADRRVTFDGADQGERIHWVGKSLVSSNESEAIGVLRMLNCGQEKPPHIIEEYNKTTIEAINILDDIDSMTNVEAKQYLYDQGFKMAQVNEILNYTKCEDIIPQYFIASSDMVGKAAVWGHFGLWDFNKAKEYQVVKNNNRDTAITELQKLSNLTQDEAEEAYNQIKATKSADNYAAPWPSYSSVSGCIKQQQTIKCQNGISYNLNNSETIINNNKVKGSIPKYTIININGSVHKKEYQSGSSNHAVILAQQNKNQYIGLFAHPELGDSMFTKLFFFKGDSLDCFELMTKKTSFRGEDIFVYKVDKFCLTK